MTAVLVQTLLLYFSLITCICVLLQASRASPPASAESIPITSVSRSAPALTPTASSRQLVAKLEFAVVKVRTSVEIDASDEVLLI